MAPHEPKQPQSHDEAEGAEREATPPPEQPARAADLDAAGAARQGPPDSPPLGEGFSGHADPTRR